MKLEKFFENQRSNSDFHIENMIGQANASELVVLYNKYGRILSEAETAVIVEACETCVYSSEELKIFKTGLQALTNLMKMCVEEQELKKAKIKEEKEKKNNKNITY